ncbi:MAG: CCA tRNA nucleotidyltransferase [Tepidisphaeraceae bacterium]|jgi:tRNA nucleotidyltransferase/poly(A) polymerase
MTHRMNAAADPRPKPPCEKQDALEVLKRLREAGHVAYFAGGCVRDTLLGLAPKDWDIATDAPPPRVRQLFPDTQAVGAAFGVILVRHRGSVIEVATFRADGPYEDGRRPLSVRFASAEEDARRRDFTINGLFLDPLENRVIDFVGGRADLESRRLRAIGVAEQRFAEDHLRLLRAVRFAARFGLEIEAATADAIRKAAPLLKGVSPERIGDELRLMLTPSTRNAAWKLIWDLNLAAVLLRLLPKAASRLDAQKSIFLHLPAEETIPFGLAVAAATLCAQVQADPATDPRTLLDKPAVSRGVKAMRQALRLSNVESDQMNQTLIGLEPLLAEELPGIAAQKRFLSQPTSGLSRLLLEALAAVGIQKGRIDWLAGQFKSLASQEIAPAPLISGDDLAAAGFSPGPTFKRVLDGVYDAQLEGKIADRDQAMQVARKLWAMSPS